MGRLAPIARRTLLAAPLLALVGALLPGVSGAFAATSDSTGSSTGSSSGSTVWLCRPGLAADPCVTSLDTTEVSPSGRTLEVDHTKAQRHPSIDCFYVYPTVSDQPTANADLTIDPVERSIALYQAARYSQYCRVFAPMYRQLTLRAIGGAGGNANLAYQDVRNAWLDYLQHDNHGRGVVLIGHSQGAFVLRQLISAEIDPKPAVRKLLVSALLMGGNVTVKQGSDIGGDFQHIPACHFDTQTGCVVAFSTFGSTPPPDALFGTTSTPGLQVLCTNPAALAGGSGLLDPIEPTTPFAPGSTLAAVIALLGLNLPPVATPWIESPGSYSAACSTGAVHALVITPQSGAPTIHPSPTPQWGLHLVDANIALGNLVELVHDQAVAFTRHGEGFEHHGDHDEGGRGRA
ncbi:MAG: DUF3089 domain-containing protein [Actinobacteria bacterium]|nr:DUF3089 domain-containing protein [Actinomycetota bacterium]